jgi:hypothetical protein
MGCIRFRASGRKWIENALAIIVKNIPDKKSRHAAASSNSSMMIGSGEDASRLPLPAPAEQT